ncbi:MAG TPA: PTS sugar transporter subunit IIB [Feifaniaceae bacterium]|nr:PTS sugar transporter subunit IIB [Feifaniaceae bacterium]
MAGNVKNILISCGTGVVTSTLATNRLSKMLDERGYKGLYKTTQYKIAELASKDEGFDVIVHTTTVPSYLKTPCVNALPLVTGVGMDQVADQVIAILWPNGK